MFLVITAECDKEEKWEQQLIVTEKNFIDRKNVFLNCDKNIMKF